jgi:hypothetical protein
MTQVCLVGSEAVNLRYQLLSHETARNALVTYDLREPFENTVAVETVSLGAAVSLLNDLNWYLVRFVDDALVLEPSVSETEWLSRALATAVRDDEVDASDSGRFLKVYGVEAPEPDPPFAAAGQRQGGEEPAGSGDDAVDGDGDDGDGATEDGSPGREPETADPPKLVEPMYVTRTGETIPDYDLREVDDTLRVRVTEAEFGA